MEEIVIARGSSVCGRTLGEAALAERTGVLVLALRPGVAAPFAANPSPDSCLDPDTILIAVGTPSQLTALHGACRP
jgi:voltage-gated potassium channel